MMVVFHHSSKAGIFGGTVLSIIPSLHLHDLGRTAILAMIGATVSFFVSMFLKWVVGLARSRLKTKFPKE